MVNEPHTTNTPHHPPPTPRTRPPRTPHTTYPPHTKNPKNPTTPQKTTPHQRPTPPEHPTHHTPTGTTPRNPDPRSPHATHHHVKPTSNTHHATHIATPHEHATTRPLNTPRTCTYKTPTPNTQNTTTEHTTTALATTRLLNTRPRHHRKHSPHRDHTTTKHPHHTDIHVPPQGHHLTDTDTGIPTHPTAGPNRQATPGPHTPVTERKPTHAKTLHHTGKHPTPHTLHRHSRPQHGGRPTGRVHNTSTPPVPTPSELAHTRITNTQATTSTPVTTHHLDPLWLPGEGFEHTARSRLCTGVTHVTITPVTLHRSSTLIARSSAGLKAGYVIPW